MWDPGFVTLINATFGDEDLRRMLLLAKTKFEVIWGCWTSLLDVLEDVAEVVGKTPTGGGTAADIMAMMPMAGAGAMDWGCGNPLGLRPVIVMPMPTEKILAKSISNH